MSATLTPELGSLKKVVLHSPAVLKLEEDGRGGLSGQDADGDGGGALSQFYLRLPRKDKRLVIYVFLKVSGLCGWEWTILGGGKVAAAFSFYAGIHEQRRSEIF